MYLYSACKRSITFYIIIYLFTLTILFLRTIFVNFPYTMSAIKLYQYIIVSINHFLQPTPIKWKVIFPFMMYLHDSTFFYTFRAQPFMRGKLFDRRNFGLHFPCIIKFQTTKTSPTSNFRNMMLAAKIAFFKQHYRYP